MVNDLRGEAMAPEDLRVQTPATLRRSVYSVNTRDLKENTICPAPIGSSVHPAPIEMSIESDVDL